MNRIMPRKDMEHKRQNTVPIRPCLPTGGATLCLLCTTRAREMAVGSHTANMFTTVLIHR